MEIEKELEPFYEHIEEKVINLKSTGMDSGQIHEILNGDIESHFNKLLNSVPNQQRKEEVAKLVDPEILDFTERILGSAGTMLGKVLMKTCFSQWLCICTGVLKEYERDKPYIIPSSMLFV